MTRKQHATRIAYKVPSYLRQLLSADPHAALTGIGLHVRSVPELRVNRGAGGWCDGLSFTEFGTILYAQTTDSRRENFTLLHEYAHRLVSDDAEATVWLADQDEPNTVLERLCDDIAGILLLPAHVVDRVVGHGPVTGQHLLDLFLQTSASQVACAIALASRLPCTGAIMLTDRSTNKVVYAALVDNPSVYPSRNQDVPTDHPLSRILPRQQVCRESFWSTPWGTRHTYYLNATARQKRTYSVLAELDLWNVASLHLNRPRFGDDGRPQNPVSCACGFNGMVSGWPCPDCEKPYCKKCGRCDCERRAALTERCRGGCSLHLPRHTLINGVCDDCR
ncbi:ImmA/IrrE family metallo-endopeptidase [Actinosynnema sp. NPDC091369]